MIRTTQERCDARFTAYIESTEEYFKAVEERGGTPWFRDTAKLAELEKRPGLDGLRADDELSRRRRLFFKSLDERQR